MPRLIDADALMIRIKDIPTWWENVEGLHPKKYPAGMFDPEDIISAIDEAPTLDVAPVVHGRWEKEPPYTSVGGEYKKALICSECHSFFVSDGNKPWQMHNYCPNCGAKMDREDSTDD